MLLCGDPGTSKSQILQYAVKLASRGIYTSGKGTCLSTHPHYTISSSSLYVMALQARRRWV